MARGVDAKAADRFCFVLGIVVIVLPCCRVVVLS